VLPDTVVQTGIVQIWRRAWAEVMLFYGFPDEVRRILYTTRIGLDIAAVHVAFQGRNENRPRIDDTVPPAIIGVALIETYVAFGSSAKVRATLISLILGDSTVN